MSKAERLGEFIGETLGGKAMKYIREAAEGLNLTLGGLENLEQLSGQQFLLVANHTKPEGNLLTRSLSGPDAQLLRSTVAKHNNQKLRIVSRTLINHSVMSGVLKSIGDVPVNKKPGSFKRDFMIAADQAIKDGDPILIFPEGEMKEGFDPEEELAPGAAHLALKYNLPILPAYFDGANSWEKGHEVALMFGPSFSSEGMDKPELTEKIRAEIARLQTDYNSNQDHAR